MATKKITVKTLKVEEKVAEMSHFGYRALNYVVKDNKTTIHFARDLGSDDRLLRDIEKQYHQISRPFPVAGTIILGIATILLLLNLFTDIHPIVDLASLMLSIILYGVGLFFVAIFIAMKVYKKRIVKELFLKGDRYQGLVRDYPLSKNIEPTSELAGMIKRNIKDIIIEK